MSYEELKGEQVTLIDFWTTWCKPCKKAIPELNKIFESYHEKGLQIIGINCDGPRSVAKVAPFSKSLHIKYPVLIDIDSELMKNLNLSSFPSILIVDRKGKIRYVHEGYIMGDEEILIEEIEKLIAD